MTILCPLLKFHEVDANGEPLVGGKLWFYKASTTDLQATYSNPEGTTPNTNPVILDSAGRAAVYLKGIYDVLVTDANDVEQYTSLLVDGGDTSNCCPVNRFVNSQSIPTGRTYTWTGGSFDESATEINLTLYNLRAYSNAPTRIYMRLINSGGELVTPVYATANDSSDNSLIISRDDGNLAAYSYISSDFDYSDNTHKITMFIHFRQMYPTVWSIEGAAYNQEISTGKIIKQDNNFLLGTVTTALPIVGFKLYTDLLSSGIDASGILSGTACIWQSI